MSENYEEKMLELLKEKKMVVDDLKSFCDEKLNNDVHFAKELVKIDGLLLKNASDKIKDNSDVALTAIDNNWKAIEFVSDRLKDCSSLVFYAMMKDKGALEFASERIKNNKIFKLYKKFSNHKNALKVIRILIQEQSNRFDNKKIISDIRGR